MPLHAVLRHVKGLWAMWRDCLGEIRLKIFLERFSLGKILSERFAGRSLGGDNVNFTSKQLNAIECKRDLNRFPGFSRIDHGRCTETNVDFV